MSQGSDQLGALIAAIPYARYLGVQAELVGEEMTFTLPFAPHLVGNPMLPALHGGVLGAFMEMTAVAQLSILQGLAHQPKPIDVSVEYLRPARAQTTYARAIIRKMGKRIANVHVEAWQDSPDTPITLLRGHFLLTRKDPT